MAEHPQQGPIGRPGRLALRRPLPDGRPAAFMVYQLRSFDLTLPNSVINHQAGVLQAAFTAAQIIMSILWGRAADQPMVGRKMVLQIGLIGTASAALA